MLHCGTIAYHATRYPASFPLFISPSAVKQLSEGGAANVANAVSPAGSSTSSWSSRQNAATRALSPFVTGLAMLSYDVYFLCCSALRFPLTIQMQETGPLHVLMAAISHFTRLDSNDTVRELSRRSRSHASAYRPLTELNLVIGGVPQTGQAVANSTLGSTTFVVGFPTLLSEHLDALMRTTSTHRMDQRRTDTSAPQKDAAPDRVVAEEEDWDVL